MFQPRFRSRLLRSGLAQAFVLTLLMSGALSVMAAPDIATTTDTAPAPAPIPNSQPLAPQSQAQSPAEAQAAPDIPAPAKNDEPATSTLAEKTVLPLLFAPGDNNIKLTSPQLKWNLSNGKRVDFGGIAHNAEDIRMQGSHAADGTWTIGFGWPQALTRTGQITILDEQGNVIFRRNVTANDLRAWRSSIGEAFAGEGGAKKPNFGVRKLSSKEIPALGAADPFRFCLTESRAPQKNTSGVEVSKARAALEARASDEQVRICSPFYHVNDSEPTAVLSVVPQTVNATVVVDGKDVGPRGIVNYDGNKSIKATVKFENGSSIDFSSKPLHLNMLDVVWDGRKALDGSRGIIFTGQGPHPLGKVRNLEVPPTNFWAETSLGYEATWQIRISESLPLLRVIGAWNIPFTFVVIFDDLPRDRDRVFVDQHTGKDTYSSAPRVHGVKRPSIRVSSKQQKTTSDAPDNFLWTFNAPKKGAFNRSRLLVQNDEDKSKWYAHYRFYRGYSFEASARVSGIITQDVKAVPVGEAAASWWPENLGADSYKFDRRRWGLTARYFRALEPIMAKTTDSSQPLEGIHLSSFNLDLKYNIQSGIWNRDQLYGAILSYQTIHINDNSGAFLGLGGYWARSMPKFLDDFFNLAPFLRYPKYLDIELILYPMAAGSSVQPRSIYNFNFHSKVFWTRQIFGELGLGLKSFGFKTSLASELNDIQLNTFFGTVGVGVTF